MKKHGFDDDNWSDDQGWPERKPQGRSMDYDKKRRRAERILEQSRIRELLGMDIDYSDAEPGQ
ncbi:hypothetical protein [Thalassolituus sp.]|uniref:hypothetical protein n=1 Tax=Thalassolituus sp. TaxID=2030822 RepID=UPI002631C4EC|nr:hypothetical protein [uncultured Thalassolituus sp.]TNC91589.1 MAG: hypothetical protein CSH36_08860 [Thalassolituus sp.]